MFTSLSTTSYGSQTGEKFGTRNARLHAGEGHRRGERNGDRFHFVEKIGSTGQVNDDSRLELRFQLLQKRGPITAVA